jgi:hypothetical protein
MENIKEFINRAADKTGFVREKYIEDNLPTSYSNINVILFFGDYKSEFVLSSLLLHKYKNSRKYYILCGWPGHAGLFPDADEYWGIKDTSYLKQMAKTALGFRNSDSNLISYEQMLNRYFENVIPASEFEKYYCNGLTSEFFSSFKDIVYKLPAMPAAKLDFNKFLSKEKKKVLIHPTPVMKCWRRGKAENFICKLRFWHDLLEALLQNNYYPIVYQNYASYDLSPNFSNSCKFIGDVKIMDMFADMRTTGCALDVFSGFSRWAIGARTPFLACTERQFHVSIKEYELDDICASNIPHQYIFSFTTMLDDKNKDLIDNIIVRLNDFLPTLDRKNWPSTSEISTIVPYSVVKEKKAKRLGTSLFKIPKI